MLKFLFALFYNLSGAKKRRQTELLELAEVECGKLVADLGRVRRIQDIESRKVEYTRIRNEVIKRRNEPIGVMLEAAFNTFTFEERNIIEGIHVQNK